MRPRLIVSDNRDDPGNPLVLDGDAIDTASKDPQAIGKIMVDQVWAEGTDPTGGASTTSATATAIGVCKPSRRAKKTS